MAAPSVIASAKERATRASVTPRLKNSAPERASTTMVLRTVAGAGNICSPAMSDAAHHVNRKIASDSNLSIIQLPGIPR